MKEDSADLAKAEKVPDAKKRKLKKSSSIIKRFKLKSRSASIASVPSGSDFPKVESVRTARQTPEGDDSNLAETDLERNLTVLEPSWKSAENLTSDEASVAEPEVSAGKERTKSLENLQAMPAFGDLILDSSPTTSNQNKTKPNKDHLYKILVIGDLGCGKTSIIKRYVHDFFSQHYKATIGVDFALKVIPWDSYTVIRLQLWDIAGQERYGNMTRVYYKEAVGAFIVFDVTRSSTFESVVNWKSDLDAKVQLPDGSAIPCVLLGNKCDQQKEGIINNPDKMDSFCKEKGFASWFETSAKENINIEKAAHALIFKILQNDVIANNENSKDKEQFTLTTKEQTENGKKCYKC